MANEVGAEIEQQPKEGQADGESASDGSPGSLETLTDSDVIHIVGDIVQVSL